MKTDDDFVTRKTQLILKEYDSAFTSYNKHVSNISFIRAWSITVFLAFIGFSISTPSGLTKTGAVVLAVLFFFLFAVLEIKERIDGEKNGLNVKEVERIFMIEDFEEYRAAIKNYVFRDLKLDEYKKLQNRRALLYLKSRSFWVWYGFLGLLSIAIIVVAK